MVIVQPKGVDNTILFFIPSFISPRYSIDVINRHDGATHKLSVMIQSKGVHGERMMRKRGIHTYNDDDA